MKTFLLICLLSASLSAVSQSLVTTNRQWHNYWSIWTPTPDSFTEVVEFTDDVIINDTTYKEVRYSTDNGVSWGQLGYIREDPTKKVWYKLEADDQEKLMYDFNAQVNDTLEVISLQFFNNVYYTQVWQMIVDSIDSTLIGDHYRKRLNMEGFPGEHWIDSTGNTGGILHNDFGLIGGGVYELECYFENQELLFTNGSACSYVTGVNEKTRTEINISPNPAKDFINIDSNEPVIMYEIYNLTGSRIIGSNQINQKSFFVPVSDLGPGIYFMKISFSNGECSIRKFVK